MRTAGFRFPSRLYPINDPLADRHRSHLELAQQVLRAGVRFLQLRVKDRSTADFVEIARAVKRLTDAAGASLIVNDRADIARLIDASGVHLGQQDLPVPQARAVLGEGKIIGLSTHSLLQVASAMGTDDVDYIGYGPIFPTDTKSNPDPVQGLEGLRAARRTCSLPIVAIGGISAATMPAVLEAGAAAVAMIGEIVRAPDVEAKVRELLDA